MKIISIILLMLCHLAFGEEKLDIVQVPAQYFLIYKTEIKSTKDIGGHAQKHIPKLLAAIKKNNLDRAGAVHHFYYQENDKSILEIAVPVKKPSGNNTYGSYTLKERKAYRCVEGKHRGPIPGIGKSWGKFHRQVVMAGNVRNGVTCEVYKTMDNVNLMSEDSIIELRDILVDQALVKGECLVTGFAKGSQAEKAGVKVGDVIKKYGDKPVKNIKDLIEAINNNSQTTKVKLTVIRGKESLEIEVNSGSLGTAIENK